jgi:uncharacterized DUF497 family protein
MGQPTFEWDEKKNQANIKKHGVSFYRAQGAFFDKNRVVAEEAAHSKDEQRYYCFGQVDEGVRTVRFTYRGSKIRIIGAGYWREGRKIYEKEQG